MLFGKLVPSRAVYPLAANTKLTSTYYVGDLGFLTKLTAYIDGLGAADASQVAQAFIYRRADDKLIGVTEEMEVPRFQGPAWVDFYFDPKNPPYLDRAGLYDVGLLGGPASGLIRVYGDDPSLRGGRFAADSYTDGPSTSFGDGVTVYTHDLSIYATGFVTWKPPVAETDFYFARLPFVEAQAKFAESGLMPRTAVTCSAGWHGTSFDPEQGSFVIVNRNSDIADRLGQRLRITRKYRGEPLSVYAYCHGWATMNEDLSLTRELYVRIAPLSGDFATVSVETMGPTIRG